MPMILYHQIHIGDDIIVNEKKVLCSKMNRVFYLSTSISGSNKQITAPKIHTSTLSTFYMIVIKPFIERCESFAQTDVLSLAQ